MVTIKQEKDTKKTTLVTPLAKKTNDQMYLCFSDHTQDVQYDMTKETLESIEKQQTTQIKDSGKITPIVIKKIQGTAETFQITSAELDTVTPSHVSLTQEMWNKGRSEMPKARKRLFPLATSTPIYETLLHPTKKVKCNRANSFWGKKPYKVCLIEAKNMANRRGH